MSLARSSSGSSPLRLTASLVLTLLVGSFGCAATSERASESSIRRSASLVQDDRPTVSHDLFAASVRGR